MPLSDDLATLKRDLVATEDLAHLESELKQAAAREAELRAALEESESKMRMFGMELLEARGERDALHVALERLIRDVCAMADDEYDNPTPGQIHDACNRAEAVLREVSK